MTTTEAEDTVKAINRYLRRRQVLAGGLTFGLDWVTWRICHPQLSQALDAAGTVIYGKPGRYLPRWRYSRKPTETLMMEERKNEQS